MKTVLAEAICEGLLQLFCAVIYMLRRITVAGNGEKDYNNLYCMLNTNGEKRYNDDSGGTYHPCEL